MDSLEKWYSQIMTEDKVEKHHLTMKDGELYCPECGEFVHIESFNGNVDDKHFTLTGVDIGGNSDTVTMEVEFRDWKSNDKDET